MILAVKSSEQRRSSVLSYHEANIANSKGMT